MTPQQGLGPLGITGKHRLEDAGMLGPDRPEPQRIAQNLSHDAANVMPMQRRGLGKQLVAGELIKKLVKCDVGGDHRGSVAGCDGATASLDEGAPCGCRRRSMTPRSTMRRHPVQCAPQLVEMRGEDGVDRRHDETPPSGFVEKSLPLQQEERLQDRLTGNRQALGEFVLNQALPGFQPPATNVVEDRGIGALHKRRLDGKSLHELWNTVYENSAQAERWRSRSSDGRFRQMPQPAIRGFLEKAFSRVSPWR